MSVATSGPGEWSSADHRQTRNGIAAFVHLIFSLYDRRAPVAELLPYLAETGLSMQFPGFGPIRGHEDFKRWYHAAPIALNSHDITILRLEAREGGEYEVEAYVAWNAVTTGGERLSMRTFQHWTVMDGPGQWPVLRQHVAMPL